MEAELVIFVVAVDDDVVGVDDARPAAIDINVDSASVDDAFLSVLTVHVEEHVDDRSCEESGLAKLG